jgi:hypothetical protein
MRAASSAEPDVAHATQIPIAIGSRKSTMTELPIACTLTPEALRERRDGLLAELLRRADAHERIDGGLRLRFAPSTDTLSALARTVEAERHCCRFLRFGIVVEPDGGPILFELTGPPGTQEFINALLDL